MRTPHEGSLDTLSLDDLLMQRRALRRSLAAREDLFPIRIAVLGGSTTSEVVNLLDLWLLESGFTAIFHQSEYGRFYIDAVHDSQALIEFKPDIVYIHTSVFDIAQFAPLQASQPIFEFHVKREFDRFKQIWESIAEKIGCIIIQNNFEFPPHAILGNLDVGVPGGRTAFVSQINREFAQAASSDSKLLLQDVCSISARIGLDRWFDRKRWFSYKILNTLEGSRALALSLTAIIRAIYGRTRKVLVLDLDNTLWGGVIGDDGVDKIQIGRETPIAEAYTSFQEYCLSLRERGVLLAVCSKNNEEIARQGFEHPDSILRLEHISSFKANWEPKHENIVRIAQDLNLSADSFVFVDDNPAERAIVAGQIRGIAVPDMGDDITAYPEIIEAGRYFEQIHFSKEDTERATLYADNALRSSFETKFSSYSDYLDSLQMTAEIGPFKSLYLERISQLTNKTNQFNLTTRRHTLAEIERISADPNYIGMYGKLSDRFGDHGLVSVVVGRLEQDVLQMDLWLMSCRVLKRGMEAAMLDALVKAALAKGVRTIIGTYVPTVKNAMVAEFYPSMGFLPYQALSSGLIEGTTTWMLDLASYVPQNRHIQQLETANV